jgi:hypothetical protein
MPSVTLRHPIGKLGDDPVIQQVVELDETASWSIDESGLLRVYRRRGAYLPGRSGT